MKNLVLIAVSACVFVAFGESRTWIGDAGESWDDPLNWSPNGVPTADDIVTVDSGWVQSAGSVSARSLTVRNGARVAVGGTTSALDAQVGADPGSTAPVVLTVTGEILLDNGQISVGGRRQTRGISATIGGDFTLRNGANAYFYAGATDGIDATNQVGSAARLYANANRVRVAGDINVEATSTLYPENEGLTGTPVFFYARNFNLAEGGTVSTVGRGWGKYKYAEGDVYPVGAVGDAEVSSWYSFAFGQGSGYQWGGGYGANSGSATTAARSHVTAEDGTYEKVSFKVGYSYGSVYAPFLPGSPNGAHSTPGRGAGSFNLFLTGTATIAGTITAKGLDMFYGAPSGGGIWIAAAAFDVTLSARLIVEGGKVTGTYSSSGGAGRIAFTVGATQEELDALAAGAETTLAKADLYGFDFNILGGYKNNGSGGRSASGTATLAYNSATTLPIAVTGTPAIYSTATPAYGFHAYPKAELPEFTIAEDYTYPAEFSNLRRYTHQGYEVSNLTGVVVGRLVDETDPLTLVWQWTQVEDLVRVRPVGGGTITVGDTTTASDLDLWITAGRSVEVAANEGTGSFVGWYGDFAGGRTGGFSLFTEVIPGLTVWGVFSDAESVAKSYVGENGGRWDVAENWSPAGVPTPVDDVTIAGRQVKSFGMTAAKSLTLTAGKLGIGGDATDTTAQTLPTAFKVSGCGLYVSGDVVATGASELSIGARRMTTPIWSAEVAGDVRLSGTTKMSVYATPYAGEVNFEGKIELPSYYDSAFAFTVGGALTLDDSASVYPEAELLTGNPVRFDVAGDVFIGEKASFNATTRGWGWVSWVNEGLDPRYLGKEGSYFTLSPGYGSSYTFGGAYGGGNATAPRKAFGFAYAPYLSGGVDGAYSICRAGGQVWIKTPGTITLKGMIVANGGTGPSTSSKSSGGGVWLIAKRFVGGPAAMIQADGGEWGQEINSSGCGGRVSIALGVSDDDLAALARGDRPDGLSYSDSISLVNASALGARSTSDGHGGYNKAPDGTLTTVIGEIDAYPLEFVSVPVQCLAEGLSYATTNVDKGVQWCQAIGEKGYDPTDPQRVRYTLSHWVISNSTEEVARGTGSNVTFLPDKGPFTLTLHWTNRETRGRVEPNDAALGSVRVGSGAAGAAADVWNAEGTPFVFEAVPADGAEFLYWTGDVPYGKATESQIEVEADKPANLRPIFRVREAACTRTWKGAAKTVKDWNAPANWEPANIPGFDDDVIVPQGTADATNAIIVGSLTVSGAAKVQVAQAAAKSRLEEGLLTVARDVVLTDTAALALGVKGGVIRCNAHIGGDFTLAGASTFSIAAGRIEGAFTHATGSGEVRVGGHLDVRGESVIRPYSERYAGGSIVFRVNRLTLAEAASFDAVNAGYRYYDDGRNPTSWGPGSGSTYQIGAGYGGYGIGYSNSKGLTYGFEYAPVQPGSAKGSYVVSGGFVSNTMGGGGLIRIHAQYATLAGTLDATGDLSSSGGGIWVTCGRRLEVLPTAVFKAQGGVRCTGAGSPGGGGRIALVWPVVEADVQELAETGEIARWREMAQRDETAKFLAEHPDVTVNVECGEPDKFPNDIYRGTFRVLNAVRYGLMIQVR